MTESLISPEWSHKADISTIGSSPLRKKISASPQERKDLARRFGIVSVDYLEAELVLEKKSGGSVIYVHGSFSGQVTQECAISLEPVTQEISDELESWFADPDGPVSFARVRQDKMSQKGGAEMEMLEESDAPEPIVNGEIDLGELVSQYFSLCIDPYVQAEGASLDPHLQDKDPGKNEIRANPFAKLKDWKSKKGLGRIDLYSVFFMIYMVQRV